MDIENAITAVYNKNIYWWKQYQYAGINFVGIQNMALKLKRQFDLSLKEYLFSKLPPVKQKFHICFYSSNELLYIERIKAG